MNDYYETTDLGLAAGLVACGFRLVDVDKTEPRRAIFVFVSSAELRQSATNYMDDCLKVSALRYFDAMRRVKARLYS